MSSLHVSVYTPAMTLIAHVPGARQRRYQDEKNAVGSGSFQINVNDATLAAHPTLLDYHNIVKFSVDGTARKAIQIESLQRSGTDRADQWITVAGRGVLSLLANAVVYPEYALRSRSADERSFDFGSKDGGWKVSGDWHIPVGITQGNPASTRKGWPRRWPDPGAQWLWSTNPNATSAPGHNYFRGTFNLTSAARVAIYAAADNEMILQLDGEPLLRASWRDTVAWVGDLSAGAHLLAADVTNLPLPGGGNNPGGFLCVVCIVDRYNRTLQIRMRSTPNTFRVRGYGSPPGWFGASILKTLVTEAKARSVAGFSPITFGFSDTLDSDGVAWTGRQDRSFAIGQRDLLDITAQLTETDFDVDMTPDLELRAWKNRGVDRRNTVRLLPARDIRQTDPTGNAAPIKTRALVRHKNGWIEHVDSAAAADYGRRETGMVVGSTSSDSQAETFSVAAFNDLGKPEETLTVKTTSLSPLQPYADYDVSDVLTTEGILGDLVPASLMALTVEQDDETGLLTFTHDLYPEP